jgi:hypothetical protein
VNEGRTILDEYVGLYTNTRATSPYMPPPPDVTLRQVEMIATINSRTSSSLA